MTEPGDHPPQRPAAVNLAPVKLAPSALLFFAALALAGAIVFPLAFFAGGTNALIAAGVAWTICVMGGLAALLIGLMLRSPALMLYQLLLGMALRMGIPFGLCLAVYARGGPLVEAGIAYFVLIFYLVTLAVDTALLLGAQSSRATDSAGAA